MAIKDFKGFKNTNDTYNCYDSKIRNNIAPTEADATSASQPYEVNEQFYLSDGNLYTATSAISQGSAIVVYPTSGYNCKLSNSVTGQIKAINDSLGTASTKNSTSVVTQSTDLVESGAVYDALGFGNKNWLNNTATNTTYSGVTYTVNADKSVDCSNTATNASTLLIGELSATDLPIGANFILSGCPLGGASNKFYLRIGRKENATDTWGALVARDEGNGVEFTVPSNDYGFVVHIGIVNGQTTGFTFYPMISKDGGAYKPYHENVSDSLAEKVGWNDAEGYVSSNVMPFNPNLGTINSVTATERDNSTIRLDGTASAITWFGISQPTVNTPSSDEYTVKLKKGSYKIICKSSAALGNGVSVSIYSSGATPIVGNPTFNSGTDNLAEFTLANDTLIYAGVRVASGTVISNMDIQVYIVRADSSNDFMPYAQTNRELTVNKCDNSVIGTVEGANASKAWSVGEHFIKDGAFKEVTQAIASGGAISDSNTVNRPIADCLIKQATFSATTQSNGNFTLTTDNIVLIAIKGDVTVIFEWYQRAQGGYTVHAKNYDGTDHGSTEVSGTYYYI